MFESFSSETQNFLFFYHFRSRENLESLKKAHLQEIDILNTKHNQDIAAMKQALSKEHQFSEISSNHIQEIETMREELNKLNDENTNIKKRYRLIQQKLRKYKEFVYFFFFFFWKDFLWVTFHLEIWSLKHKLFHLKVNFRFDKIHFLQATRPFVKVTSMKIVQ